MSTKEDTQQIRFIWMTVEGECAYVNLLEVEYCALAGHPSTGPAPATQLCRTLPRIVFIQTTAASAQRKERRMVRTTRMTGRLRVAAQVVVELDSAFLPRSINSSEITTPKKSTWSKGLWAYWSLRTVYHIRVLPDMWFQSLLTDVICDYKLTMTSNFVQKLRFIDKIHIWNSQGLLVPWEVYIEKSKYMYRIHCNKHPRHLEKYLDW